MRWTNHRGGSLTVAEHPVRQSKNLRRQVSRLAEQDFSSDPRLPDLSVSGALGSLRSRSRGRLLFGAQALETSSPIAFPLRLSWDRNQRRPTICPSVDLVKP